MGMPYRVGRQDMLRHLQKASKSHVQFPRHPSSPFWSFHQLIHSFSLSTWPFINPYSRTSTSAIASLVHPQPTTPSTHPHLSQDSRELTNLEALEAALCNLRKALGMQKDVRLYHEVLLTGHGMHLGAEVVWSLRLRPDGAFIEEIIGKHLTLKFGHDGAPNSACWEVESTGVSKSLEFDDHEALLLSTWMKTGAWLLPQLRDRMDMYLLLAESNSTLDEVYDIIRESDHKGEWVSLPTTFSGRSADVSKEICIGVKLKGGRMLARVRVDTLTWQPLGLSQPLCGDLEIWQYATWAMWDQGLLYPLEVLHHVYAGGRHHYVVTSGRVLPKAPAPVPSINSYATPLCPSPLPDTDFDTTLPSTVPAWITRSGHILVKPEIDGQQPGYFLLDTGASGFVIERHAADELQLQSFGELFVASIAGKVKSSFRKARELKVGPVTIRNPIMMEMPMAGVVRGAPGPMVGIIGYEFFRRTVVEIPASPPINSRSARTSTATATSVTVATTARNGPHAAAVTGARPERGQQQYQITLHDPASSNPDWAQEEMWEWLPLHMVANLPHVKSKFKAHDGMVHDTLFMLDTGASGADLMFHARAIGELGLLSPKMLAAKHRQKVVKGVGGEAADSMRTTYGDLAWIQVASNRYQNVRALFALSGGLDVSLYSSGLMCADLVTRTKVVIDYSRKRIGLSRT